MKKFNPVEAFEKLNNSYNKHEGISITTWLRLSQGLQLVPLLIKRYESVELRRVKANMISVFLKNEEDKTFKGMFLQITFKKRY